MHIRLVVKTPQRGVTRPLADFRPEAEVMLWETVMDGRTAEELKQRRLVTPHTFGTINRQADRG